MHVKKSPPSRNALIADLAARQHGVVARRQLLALGVTREAIAHRVAAGLLHRVHRGVYAVGHPGLTREGRWRAAVLAAGPGGVLSHRAAAALWGFGPAWMSVCEVSGPRAVHARGGLTVHRPRRLEAGDRTLHRGIPVTTVARTLTDLADVVGDRALRRAVERAEALRLDARPQPLPGRRGEHRLARVLSVHTPHVPLTRSDLEARFLELVTAHGLPAPLANAAIDGMEVDFCWPGDRLVVEADGWAAHGTRTAFTRDRRRSAALQLAGWTVVRFTYDDVVRDPSYVAHTLRALLGG